MEDYQQRVVDEEKGLDRFAPPALSS